MKKLKFELNNSIKLAIKWMFVIALLIFLINKFSQDGISFKFGFVAEIFSSPFLVSLMILLTLANWYFDTIAWKKVSKDHEEINLKEALETNLISQYLGVLTPFGLGEYRAKMRIFNNKEERNQSVVNTMSYRWSKSISKFGIGLVAVSYLFIKEESPYIVWLLLAWLVYVLFVFKYKVILKWSLEYFKLDDKLGISVNRVNVFPSIIPSALKFLSYALQFALIVNGLFQIPFIDGLMYGVVLYAVTSFIPQASFLDPIIKGGIATYLLPELISAEAMLSTVLTIWIFNIGAPAVIGSILWFKPKKKMRG